MPYSDYPILGAEMARARKRFWHPLLTSKPATMTQCLNHYPSLSNLKSKGLSLTKMKWCANRYIYIYIYMYLLPLIQRDIEHMLQIKMARKRKGEVGFSWTDDELQFPLESSLDFKSKCEFQGES